MNKFHLYMIASIKMREDIQLRKGLRYDIALVFS